MFIPSEAVYYEVVTGEYTGTDGKSLFEFAAAERVFPVSPGTLYPYLTTIALGLRGLHIEQHARDIIDAIDQVGRNYKDLGTDWRKAQKQLSDAQRNLEEVMQQIDSTNHYLNRTVKQVYSNPSSNLEDYNESD